MKQTNWVLSRLYANDYLNRLSSFDRLRYISLFHITHFGLTVSVFVIATNAFFLKPDRAFQISLSLITFLPTVWLIYKLKVNLACWAFLSTLYINAIWWLYVRLTTHIDSHIELNFILIGFFSVILMDGKTSSIINLFLGINYLLTRLAAFHFIETPFELGQLINGGAVFGALAYVGYAVKSTVLQMQLAVREQNTELLRMNSTKDKLFTIIGHDLLSPIAGLKTQLNTLQAGYTSPLRFGQRTDQLIQLVDGVYQTLNNLLQWAMLQRNRTRTQPSPLDLSTVAQFVLNLYLVNIESKGLTVTTKLDTARACVDEHQLSAIMRNLLHNAIKFTHPGGTIQISTRTHNNRSFFIIQDSGVGMPIHGVGNQPDGVVTSQYGTNGEKGTGLGLELCREFVKLNGGSLVIESAPGRGATITIDFPLQAD
ncbi:sensor histidine kinase [Fibrella forsythiae]|uniref:histidine kinase n=1 Tax=Fibrella forsythiae TaxID=2817061 RepID=A0ABS3JGD2_9BACT|nr:HAMP domain-containing sensor histidine kinase [Fibrella forsythiae]MBO0948478.1 HAMP domain-containing histidine kinase [Fibrella forsythiae]